MIRTVVAFEREESRKRVAEMLEKAGITVRFRCKTGADVIRAVKLMGRGVVICGYKLPDMSADELAFELSDHASFLILAKPTQLDMCENQEVFKLPIPVTPGELAGSVNILVQMDRISSKTTIPQPSREDNSVIMEAKAFLMERNRMTEEQAHRFIQRKSMESSTRMTETARLILSSADTL
ncbi:MAG: ANTAR domain-containing response regulator [Oscillospiraceae bacterium]